MGIEGALAGVKDKAEEPVPLHLRDTHYQGSSQLGNGKGYKYPHDYPGHYVAQDYMPSSVKGDTYYRPSEMGQERKIAERHRLLHTSKQDNRKG